MVTMTKVQRKVIKMGLRARCGIAHAVDDAIDVANMYARTIQI